MHQQSSESNLQPFVADKANNSNIQELEQEQIQSQESNWIGELDSSDVQEKEHLINATKDANLLTETTNTWLNPFQTIFKYLKFIVPWLWAVVIIVVFIPMIGELFIAKAFQAPTTSPTPQPALVTPAKPTPQAVDWNLVKQSVHKELKVARHSLDLAQDLTSGNLS